MILRSFGSASYRAAKGVWPAVVAALLLGALWVGAAQGAEVYGVSARDLGLYLGSNLLASWRVAEARQWVDRLAAERPDDPQVRALEARVLFFEGRYAEARDLLEQLEAEGPFRDLVETTWARTRSMRARAGGGFRVFWDDPKDEILVDPALEGLARAREAVAERLGFDPAGEEVRVEIYPTAAAFTEVSTLTRKEVETSGTIGLCKFDRIMITSPRATLWGYRWRDTLCHEYVHLAVYRLSRGQAPIWVHEGVAKYLEGAWRGETGEVGPAGRALLARRMREGTLISLEEMSPSVAKLPSAEDTALAFAEVGTMMAFLVQQRGPDALQRLVEGIGDGLGDREALAAVWGGPFDAFDRAWREWVEAQGFSEDPVEVLGLHLADRGGEGEEPSDAPDPQARDYLRLGDLLRGKGRMAAAAVEYEKAYASAPRAPGVASRHVLGLLTRGRFDEAVSVADQALRLYPDLAVLWYRKALALWELDRPGEALDALDEVLEINPFHLPTRRLRAEVLDRLGRLDAARAEAEVVALLEGGPPSHGRTAE